MKPKLKAIISTALVAIILCINAGNLISYALDTYKTATELENQGTSTSNENVEFDVYYDGGKHTNTLDITEEGAKVYVSVKVKNAGYLENAEIDFSDCNFNIANSQANSETVQSVDTESKVVTLNKIAAGNTVVVELNITPIKDDMINANSFNKDNTISLTGTYIDSKAESKSITGSITINTKWDGEAKLQLSEEVARYILLSTEGSEGVLLQTKISLNVEDYLLPIKSTTIDVTAPTLCEEKPVQVLVYANTTSATNGENSGTNFTKENYTYDTETGITTITVENAENSQGQISWAKNCPDEYLVTYIYSAEVYSAITEQENTQIGISLEAEASCTLYNDVETTVTANVSSTSSGIDVQGNVVDVTANITQTEIAKGYMYANTLAEDEYKNETTYNVEYLVETSYTEVLDNITIAEDTAKFVSEAKELDTASNVYTKSITVEKEALEKILGEEGYITVTANGELQTININSQVNVEGNVVLDLSSANANNITIEIVNPVEVGQLKINVEKAISTACTYSLDTLKEITQLKTGANAKVTYEETNLEDFTTQDSANFVEPTSKAEISVNNTTFSTVVDNDVEIKVVLEADSQDDLLYKDPVVDVYIPSYVSNITLNDAKALYEDELTASGVDLIEQDGYKVIRITVSGTQTKYYDNISKGLTIQIYATISTNRNTPSATDTIKMVYQNGAETGTTNTASLDVQFVSPKGVISINSLSNFNSQNETITIADDQTGTAQLETYASSVTATAGGEIVNNYDNTISDVSILGRIPNAELEENTFNTSLNGEVTLLQGSGTVYYSDNASATKDLENTSNNWTTTVEDGSSVKSYLIVLEGDLAKAGTVSWEYKLNIPSGLNYNNYATSEYTVYLKNNAESGTVAESKESPVITMQTEKGPEIEVEISSIDVENGGTITNGKRIGFNITVTNTGSKDLSNTKLEIPMPDGMPTIDGNFFIAVNEETGKVETEIGSLTAGTSQEISLNFYAQTDEDCTAQVIAQITAIAEDAEVYIQSEPYIVNIDGDTDIVLTNTTPENYYEATVGDNYMLMLYIENISEETIKNLVVTYSATGGLEFVENTIDDSNLTVSYKDNTIIINVKELLPGEENNEVVIINGTVTSSDGSIKTSATATVNGKEYTSNIIQIDILKTECSLEVENPESQYVDTGDEITNTFTITNTGEVNLSNTELIYQVPEGTTLISAIVEYNGKEYGREVNEENDVTFIVPQLSIEESVTFTIKLQVTLEEAEDYQEIVSTLQAVNKSMNTQEATLIYYVEKIKEETTDPTEPTNPVEPTDPENPTEPTDPEEPANPTDPQTPEVETARINGKAWIDENKDGKQDSQEIAVSGMTVILINRATEEIFAETTTNDSGSYVIDDIPSGEYMVAFLYDTEIYVVTAYKKEGVSDVLNSNAVTAIIKYNGEDTTVGLTDAITINGENIDNINIGIYEAEKFDLSLQKYVSKITINNNEGVVTYDYTGQNKTLAKVDIPAKYIEGSTVIIEYTIEVTNQGDVAGYAKKIVDYLADDLKFSSELNQQAYVGTDGNIYSEELAKTIINPGETKQISLILTKQMTENNTGTIVNKAEIVEDYNELGLDDINSTPGNNNEKENDTSYANAIITVKTGQIAVYAILIITTCAILIIGIYVIKKYVLNGRIK